MTGRARANGEGSIFPYRNGFAAYVWVSKPNGSDNVSTSTARLARRCMRSG
jgi:hypothetical protein